MILKGDKVEVLYVRPAKNGKPEKMAIEFRGETFVRTTKTFPTDEHKLHTYLRRKYANRKVMEARYA